MLEVTTASGAVYVLTNGRMERRLDPSHPYGPYGYPVLVINGSPFKLHSPLSIGSPLHAYVYGLGNIRTTPVRSIVEHLGNNTTFHRADPAELWANGHTPSLQERYPDLQF